MVKKKIKSKKIIKKPTGRSPSEGDKSSKVRKLIRMAKAGKFKKKKSNKNSKKVIKKKRR
jgi:hypothetical protein